jgi:nucleotide-binding universal stress UspA family protein
MAGWKRIGCAVDFEAPSRAALGQAIDLARRLDAELTLLHVAVPPPDVVGAPLGAEFEAREAVPRLEEETLERWRVEAEQRAGRPVRSRRGRGHPAAELLRLLREGPCDVLVVGTHGRSGVPRLVLGSVAERVARDAPCPVLVVHDHAEGLRADVEAEAAAYR